MDERTVRWLDRWTRLSLKKHYSVPKTTAFVGVPKASVNMTQRGPPSSPPSKKKKSYSTFDILKTAI